MKYTVENREPISLFRFFEEISAIPRGSGNERGIADYLCGFAEARSLWYYRDQWNNVLIKKPATEGLEARPAIMLQAHTDMVCEKLPEKQHDFLNDPITLLVNGDTLTADGTTLGADNGVGVAAMLAVLDDDRISAPALECLFTTCEETGMDGAIGFDYTKLSSRTVVNLDSTDEGEACCGCAGGVNTTLYLDCERVALSGKTVYISVSGLAGGHSGVDIDLGRQNAIKLLSEALLSLYGHAPFCLVTISGGAKPNVIPSSAYAVASFYDAKAAKDADKFLRNYFDQAKINFIRADKKMKFSFKNLQLDGEDAVNRPIIPLGEGQLSFKSTHKLLSLLAVSPNGVLKYMPGNKEQVLSSVNQGVLVQNGNSFALTFFARSGFDFEFERTVTALNGLGRLYGARVVSGRPTPGWKYKIGGELSEAYSRVCEEVLGKKAVFTNIHAGLECGVIVAAMNEIDGKEIAQAISIGPDLRNIHSVKESVSLSSCERFYMLITKLLGEL